MMKMGKKIQQVMTTLLFLPLQNGVALEVNDNVSFVECCRAAHIAELGDGEQRSAFQCGEKVHGSCFARQTWKRELGCNLKLNFRNFRMSLPMIIS